MMNGLAIHEICKSSILLKTFNHQGQDNVSLPNHFDKNQFNVDALDYFDHGETALSGIEATHDTVSILFQDKQEQSATKPNGSDFTVKHMDQKS
ncbi:hypothetical protein FQR65_LT01067 [Abscondita terminalis]|nr:hypothetical protein FQR65_LT01067 [Abscondita terminalis]